MENKKELQAKKLDPFDLEIFTSLNSYLKPKKPFWQEILEKNSVKTVLTIILLLFLFGSTFLIAEKIAKPTLTISKADIKYVPQAKINIPTYIPQNQIKNKVSNCQEVKEKYEKQTFLYSFCQGEICKNQKNKESCESVDVIVLKDEFLSEESGQDGIQDCLWVNEESLCKPRY